MTPAPHPPAIRWNFELTFEPGSHLRSVISTGGAWRRPSGTVPARSTNSACSAADISSTIASPEFVFHSLTRPLALPVKRREPLTSSVPPERSEFSWPSLVLNSSTRGAVPERAMNSLTNTSPPSHRLMHCAKRWE